MPLIILSGYPTSGKTQRAEQLVHYFESSEFQSSYPHHSFTSIHVINDTSLNLTRAIYNDPIQEKKARAAMLSSVERLLSPTSLVIADAMNYIKGLRYQLYCIARAIGTPHCVVYSAVPSDLSLQWNTSLGDKGYSLETCENLISRFEEPNGMNRWDSPLFLVLYSDAEPPFTSIADALIHRKPAPPNLSTAIKPMMPSNYVYELDQITNEWIQVLFPLFTSYPPGQWITVPQTQHRIQIPPFPVSLMELKKLRKQFVSINKQRTVQNLEHVQGLFLKYISEQLK